MDILKILGRSEKLFESDLEKKEKELNEIISSHSFLVLGGAGSIGQAVVKELFRRNPKVLHVIDISENNLAELVRDLRSSIGYISGDFKAFALDISSLFFDKFIEEQKSYDYVMNLSALKHVRSEKDVFTLMRMIEVNIFNTEKTIKQAQQSGAKKYFCVSTDKAANPVNLMGSTKRIMEKILVNKSEKINISTARFANVAFSDGSLLYGFQKRIQKNQPIVIPKDVKRFFVTPEESGELCLMSTIFGSNREIFFPKLNEDFQLTPFSDILERYLHSIGYKPYICKSEDEARSIVNNIKHKNMWPCLYVDSDTTGEKSFEEFYTNSEKLDLNSFQSIGIIKNDLNSDEILLENFRNNIVRISKSSNWQKSEIVLAIKEVLPELDYRDLGKNLDQKM